MVAGMANGDSHLASSAPWLSSTAPWQSFDAVHISGCTSKLLESTYRPYDGVQIPVDERFFRDAARIAAPERSALLLYNFTTNCLEGCWYAESALGGQIQWAVLDHLPSAPFAVFQALLTPLTRLPPVIPLRLAGDDAQSLLHLLFNHAASLRGAYPAGGPATAPPPAAPQYQSTPQYQPPSTSRPAAGGSSSQLPYGAVPPPFQAAAPAAAPPSQQAPPPRPVPVSSAAFMSTAFPWMQGRAGAAPEPAAAAPPPPAAAAAAAPEAAAGLIKHLCPLCRERKADYINYSCRHLGPCNTCCPGGKESWEEKYPSCTTCGVEGCNLMRVHL